MAFDAPHIVTGLTTLVIVILCVLFHYEGLSMLSRWVGRDPLVHRARIAALIFGQLVLHMFEILFFASGYYLLSRGRDFGSLLQLSYLNEQVPNVAGFIDYVYFSAVVYSTLGFGDLVPSGPLRFLTGIEAVVGLVLITWSASFTFLEMQRYWGRD